MRTGSMEVFVGDLYFEIEKRFVIVLEHDKFSDCDATSREYGTFEYDADADVVADRINGIERGTLDGSDVKLFPLKCNHDMSCGII